MLQQSATATKKIADEPGSPVDMADAELPTFPGFSRKNEALLATEIENEKNLLRYGRAAGAALGFRDEDRPVIEYALRDGPPLHKNGARRQRIHISYRDGKSVDASEGVGCAAYSFMIHDPARDGQREAIIGKEDLERLVLKHVLFAGDIAERAAALEAELKSRPAPEVAHAWNQLARGRETHFAGVRLDESKRDLLSKILAERLDEVVELSLSRHQTAARRYLASEIRSSARKAPWIMKPFKLLLGIGVLASPFLDYGKHMSTEAAKMNDDQSRAAMCGAICRYL